MNERVFINKDGQRYGPFTEKEVVMLISEGLITKSDIKAEMETIVEPESKNEQKIKSNTVSDRLNNKINKAASKKAILSSLVILILLVSALVLVFNLDNISLEDTTHNLEFVLTRVLVEEFNQAEDVEDFNNNDQFIYLLVNTESYAGSDAPEELAVDWWYRDPNGDLLLLSDNKLVAVEDKLVSFTLQRPVFGWDFGDYYAVLSLNGMPEHPLKFMIQ